MDAELHRKARDVIAGLRETLNKGGDISHKQMIDTVAPVFDLRNRMLDAYRRGALSRELLDRANAIASLAYSTKYPLSGVHAHRVDEACKALSDLIEIAGRGTSSSYKHGD